MEKKGFENKGYMDIQADEMVLYAALHDAEWGHGEDRVWMELATRLPCWAWKKWFFYQRVGGACVRLLQEAVGTTGKSCQETREAKYAHGS